MTNENELSYWGWGYDEKFPDRTAREQLGSMVSGVLGLEGLSAQDPVPIDEIEIRTSRITIPDRLKDLITSSREARIRHTYGRSFPDLLRGFRGDFAAAPDAVAFPESEDDIRALYRFASENDFALIPRGGGTSVVGGVCGDALERPFIVVSLRRMNALLDVDKESLLARIQAGATGPEFETQLREHGLTFRHFPQSYEFSTIGGWIVTRAGGHFATVYTRMDDFVASTRMITGVGDFESRTLPGSGAGPSPDQIVIGSEGILGLVSEAWIRVHEPPRHKSSGTFRFKSFDDAVGACRRLAQSRLFPSNCRLLDANEAMINQVVFDGSNVLIVSFESTDDPTQYDMERAEQICTEFGGTCPDGLKHRSESATDGGSDTAGSWKQAFFDGPYRQNILLSLGAIADTFETSCTWKAFPAMHQDILDSLHAVIRENCGRGTVTCRFTHVYPDGPAPYYTFITEAESSRVMEQWTALKRAASEAIMRHKGTITHHHSVGRTHRPWYDEQRPDLFAKSLRATKDALDPAWILNPGVLIDKD